MRKLPTRSQWAARYLIISRHTKDLVESEPVCCVKKTENEIEVSLHFNAACVCHDSFLSASGLSQVSSQHTADT